MINLDCACCLVSILGRKWNAASVALASVREQSCKHFLLEPMPLQGDPKSPNVRLNPSEFSDYGGGRMGGELGGRSGGLLCISCGTHSGAARQHSVGIPPASLSRAHTMDALLVCTNTPLPENPSQAGVSLLLRRGIQGCMPRILGSFWLYARKVLVVCQEWVSL